MALSIKDEGTDRLVRRYARLHSTSYTKAINHAVAEALRREGQPVNDEEDEEDFLTFIHHLQERVAKHPIIDPRNPDDILYDEEWLAQVIVVDTSALAAIHFREPDADVYAAAIARSGEALIGAATAFEFLLVTVRKQGTAVIAETERLLQRREFEIAAWTPDLVPIAVEALRRFSGRPARLNFGDCLAYALAKSRDVPLLYKGDDFAQTDIVSALS